MLSYGGDPLAPGRVRVALIGTFDVDNYGDHLFPRVAAHELGRRLRGAETCAFAPYGWLHPTGLDDGRASSPLGPWTPERARQLAAAHHLVVVGGGELIHLNDPMLAPVYGTTFEEMDRLAPSRFFVEGLGPELEAECPVVWHGVGVPWTPVGVAAGRLRTALAGRPYVTVRDRHSAQRLADAGVGTPIEVVPDSALLIDRIMPPESLHRRLEKLRAAGGYPGPGVPVLVVQGCELLVPHVEGVAAAVAALLSDGKSAAGGEVVVVETGRCRGDGVFSAALQRALPAVRLWRLPEDAAVEDLAAAIAGGDLFVGSSLHGAITALTYGRPFVLLNIFDDAKLDGFGDLTGLDRCVVHAAGEISFAVAGALAGPAPPGLVDSLQRRLDGHFDRIAEIAAERASARPSVAADPSLDVYAVTDHLGRLRAGLGTVQAQLGGVEAGLARAEARLATLQRTARSAGRCDRGS